MKKILQIIYKQKSDDGICKYAFETGDGHIIESVLIPNKSRQTLCVSSQVGCRIKCSFCATATIPFVRNLTSEEILAQLDIITGEKGTLNNIVFMGMGEPLDNYANVKAAVLALNDHKQYNIGQRHISISTVGLADMIRKFSDDNLPANLTVSLHSASDIGRKAIMGPGHRCSIEQLGDALEYYRDKVGRKIILSYCLIANINDSDSDLGKLIELAKSLDAQINLMQFNAHEKCSHRPASRDQLMKFHAALDNAGVTNTIRFSKGNSIAAACGQLARQRQ
ncbi:MAG: 23S rRNA (adenine(2503)-C(2))-methyltransferase RlmN [Phycisphaerae bacterium]|nr:23S rRNA (adenine(2503)-C(2))-methyltransferase RlmN [Phycisphaerae bacterium]